MRLVSFQSSTACGVGLVQGDSVLPVTANHTMLDLIENWEAFGAELVRSATGPCLSLDALILQAPIQSRRNLLCIGWNYRAHFEEGKPQRGARGPEIPPDYPTLFSKATGSVAGPYDNLPLHHRVTAKLDWEAELAVVIGREGVDIAEEDALDHVFGYMVANDVSARDLQQRHGGQWFKGKSLNDSCPLGPWIITRDEIPDPQQLNIYCKVNGEIKQQANTRQQMFGVGRLISILSEGMSLYPGDIILTGTPEGVGNSRNPPEYLTDGDVLETEIDGIGILRNLVIM